MALPEPNGPTQFAATCATAIGSVLTTIAGESWNGEPSSAGLAVDDVVPLNFLAQHGLAGSLKFSLARADALRLVGLFTGETAEGWRGEQQEALEELFRQFAGELASRLKAEYGDVTFAPGPTSSPAAEAARCVLALRSSGGEPVLVALSFDEAFAKSLLPAATPEAMAPPAVPVSSSNNLDLLMDVELAVTLRFGQRRMLLEDILNLQSGSVIELDREIQQPVELLLEEKVIARGEVVVVDGNYGLRVTEVASSFAEA